MCKDLGPLGVNVRWHQGSGLLWAWGSLSFSQMASWGSEARPSFWTVHSEPSVGIWGDGGEDVFSTLVFALQWLTPGIKFHENSVHWDTGQRNRQPARRQEQASSSVRLDLTFPWLSQLSLLQHECEMVFSSHYLYIWLMVPLSDPCLGSTCKQNPGLFQGWEI